MQVEALNLTGTVLQQQPRASDSISLARKDATKGQQDLGKKSESESNSIQPEEILHQIKALTEDGLYSVRFEKNTELDELVVKIVDSQTDEVIRQVPAEEIVGLKATLAELRGTIVNTIR